jgi:hypothetical protein
MMIGTGNVAASAGSVSTGLATDNFNLPKNEKTVSQPKVYQFNILTTYKMILYKYLCNLKN